MDWLSLPMAGIDFKELKLTPVMDGMCKFCGSYNLRY